MVSMTKQNSGVSICNPVGQQPGWNFRFGRRAGETVDSELQEESGYFYWLRS